MFLFVFLFVFLNGFLFPKMKKDFGGHHFARDDDYHTRDAVISGALKLDTKQNIYVAYRENNIRRRINNKKTTTYVSFA